MTEEITLDEINKGVASKFCELNASLDIIQAKIGPMDSHDWDNFIRCLFSTMVSHAAQESAKAVEAVYHERAQVVSFLSKFLPAGKKDTNIESWDPEWHGCVFIDAPCGQLSWHYHSSDANLFDHLPEYKGEWDGHSTEQKYNRMFNYPAPLSVAPVSREGE